MTQEQRTQRLREWLLKNEYLHLNPEKDGQTAWGVAEMILRDTGINEEVDLLEMQIGELRDKQKYE